jgi:hypothetical protein
MGMPRRRSLVRAGRSDLVTRVSSLGDWSSVALALGFESSRKPDGYWENIDLLRDALLQLVHAFWFEETETTESGATQTFWYNDVSGALTFEEPDVASGGGLDQPVMPAMADVLEARRWDVHQAILLHGGYKEVALALGWLPKRTSENRHLLQFSALAREMESFIAESGDALGLPKGRFPSEAMLLANDRDDLAQGVRWHGGFVRVARRMGKLNFAASAMADAEEAARALRAFALQEQTRSSEERRRRGSFVENDATGEDASFAIGKKHRHARLLGVPVMPTEARLLSLWAARSAVGAAHPRPLAAGRRRWAGGSQPRGPGDEDVAEDAPGVRRGARVYAQRRAAAPRLGAPIPGLVPKRPKAVVHPGGPV